MENLRSQETGLLVERLAALTARYTSMLNDAFKNEEDFARCHLEIRAILTELEFRKQSSTTNPGSPSNLIIPED